MPILGIIASGISGNLYAPTGNYESIATVTVGSGGSSSVSFTSIPSTYTHLQVRAILRGTSALGEVNCESRFNSDSGSNYSRHQLYGDGSAVGASATTSSTIMVVGSVPDSSKSANIFGSFVLDILDYTNTNKYKTTRTLYGYDANGSGIIILRSNLWMSTSAISSISFSPASNNWAQYSSFSLYGVK